MAQTISVNTIKWALAVNRHKICAAESARNGRN
jgi:hypothetical protein